MRFRRALGEREKKNPVRPPLFVLFQYSYMNAAIWYLTQQHSGINKTDATPETNYSRLIQLMISNSWKAKSIGAKITAWTDIANISFQILSFQRRSKNLSYIF